MDICLPQNPSLPSGTDGLSLPLSPAGVACEVPGSSAASWSPSDQVSPVWTSLESFSSSWLVATLHLIHVSLKSLLKSRHKGNVLFRDLSQQVAAV
jgi:hypothetical protein